MYITAQGCRLQNDLYCVEWDVKLYYTIPCHALVMAVDSNMINCELPFTCLLDINGNLDTMQKTIQFTELIFIVGLIMCRFH